MRTVFCAALLLSACSSDDDKPTATSPSSDSGLPSTTDTAPPCPESIFYADADQDGFGDPETAVSACEAPDGYVDEAGDCDDSSAAARPGGDEVCDGLDNDCDGQVDFNRVPEDYPTIQDAIASLPHDTEACVAAGTWSEPIVFGDRQITLVGAGGAEGTFLDTSGVDGPFVT
ncbi:MAG: putative metal-binding motif-containing protein, partial [Myxococcota bacterium]